MFQGLYPMTERQNGRVPSHSLALIIGIYKIWRIRMKEGSGVPEKFKSMIYIHVHIQMLKGAAVWANFSKAQWISRLSLRRGSEIHHLELQTTNLVWAICSPLEHLIVDGETTVWCPPWYSVLGTSLGQQPVMPLYLCPESHSMQGYFAPIHATHNL